MAGVRRKGTTSARGYGWSHQRARAHALATLHDGDPCPRCGGPMYRGQALDLDHADDRASYHGLAHATCNRRAGGQAKAQRRKHTQRSVTPRVTPQSRAW